MKIAVMEKTNFSKEQLARLEKLGSVDCFDGLSEEQAASIAPNYDIVVVNWIDPSSFLLKMHSGSMVALLSTGYGWIQNMEEARKNNVLVSNIPHYSTEAVAEHLLGMLLGVSKRIFPALNGKSCDEPGFEIAGKTVGVIGLGDIGSRFAEIMHFFGADIITYNRNRKGSPIAKDVGLEELLSQSDIICITCSQNQESKNLININNYTSIKPGAIVIGSTWTVFEETAMIKGVLENRINAVSFDAALEGDTQIEKELAALEGERVFFTPHIAYNTAESEVRQLDICVNNIASFVAGRPINIVN